MSQSSNNKLASIVSGFIFSLPIGLLFASIYVTFRDGFRPSALNDFDLLAFWYVTPFYTGFVSEAFYTCLKILAGTSVIMLAGTLILVFYKKSEHHGTAHWARFQEMARAGYIKNYAHISGPIFGKTTRPGAVGKYLTNGDQPHSLVVAPTRAGKGVGVVIPTLLTFDGSVLALDVKGELFELTSRAREARGDKVYKFSPFDPEGRTNSYNPVLDIVHMPENRRFAEARRLAVNLVVAKGKGSEGFIDGARDLLVAGILYCIENGNPTIGAVYDLFTQPGEKYKLFAGLAEKSNIPEVTRIFDNMAGNDTKIITSYTSVLGDGGLNLWADHLIKRATTTSDFSIYDLRRDPCAIYLVVSPNDLEVIAPLIRLFFQQIVSILQREIPGDDEIFEVLFLLDEFKHLGRLESIETAITTIAGYKGRFMFIIQSLAALTGAYEQSGKENFLSNTGVQVFMATADDETPKYISQAIGDYTYNSKSMSWNRRDMLEANIQQSKQGAPLIRSEQLRLMDDDTQIVLIKGQPPLKMPKIKYYADRKLKRVFESQTGPLPEPEPIADSMTVPLELSLPETPAPQQSDADAPVAAAPDVVGISQPDAILEEEVAPQQEANFTDTYKTELEEEIIEETEHLDKIVRDAIAERQLKEEEYFEEFEEDSPSMVAQRQLLDKIKALQDRETSNSNTL